MMKFLAVLIFKVFSAMSYKIQTEWDGKSINHVPAEIKLSWKPDDDYVTAVFQAPFFDDPPAPAGPSGKAFPQLWDYEVVEIFFLSSSTKQYLEVEVSPHGQHLLLLLNGTRNMIEDELPMKYTSKIDKASNTWTGTAQIPLSYFPKNVDKMNAYAIHGNGDNRVYESLYPTPTGKYDQPDFHRLDYFQDFDISKLFQHQGPSSLVGKYWKKFNL